MSGQSDPDMSKEYLAHINDKGEGQRLSDHLEGVARIAAEFAEAFGAGEFAGETGRHHDDGKHSGDVQKRIRGAAIRTDHSTAGGQVLYAGNENMLGRVAASCVFGHHAGLPDGGGAGDGPDMPTLVGRLKKQVDHGRDFVSPVLPKPLTKLSDSFSASFFTRMVFSCLVDADYLDTEAFMKSVTPPRGGHAEISVLKDRLFTGLEKFSNPANELDRRRTELRDNCVAAAERDKGLFTLTAPTGSGKTLSGAAFCLAHAAKHAMDRIIFVVPYNTIIEQNAKVLEDYLGADNVLQHHSNISYDGEEFELKQLASENWDFPVIVTSSVQFFESLFSNRPSRCRKLHNLANSVIFFDESQMIPLPFLLPCVRAIRELVEAYGCTAVLASATQASLGHFFKPLETVEITQNPQELYTALRRVNISRLPQQIDTPELAERILQKRQILCVVNTIRQVQELFGMLKERTEPGSCICLSTAMHATHRSRALELIRKKLEAGEECRVVSTSLVEAGVNLDFPFVMRQEAGLDSIVQVAGRCNREGKNPLSESNVQVFELSDHKPPDGMLQAINTCRSATINHPDDMGSLEAVSEYFAKLFYNRGDKALDASDILDKLSRKNGYFSFREAADAFRLIDDDTQGVYVLDEAPELEKRLRAGERTRELMRSLGPYMVSLRRYEAQYQLGRGMIERLDEEVCLLIPGFYDQDCGILIGKTGGRAVHDR